MKTLIVVILPMLIIVPMLAMAANASECVDLSGAYQAPYESSAGATTIYLNQSTCSLLSISGMISSSGGVIFIPAKYYDLSGKMPTDCGSTILNTCGSYTLMSSFVLFKVAGDSAVLGDQTHGACFYDTARLFKDKNGDLVREAQNVKCEDGFSGTIAPEVFVKVN